MGDVTLSAGVRQNLLSLQQTASMMSQTQNRLATGKKVNSALDNPTNYFTASNLNSRAKDLGNLLDGISNATKTLQAADNGIKGITKLVESAQSTARQALQDGGAGSGTVVEGASSVSTSGVTPTSGESLQSQVKRQTLSGAGFANNDTISITTTNTTTGAVGQFTYTVTGTDTIQDMVDDINASGVVSAEITEAGKLKLTGTDQQTVALGITNVGGDASTTTTQATSLAAGLGFGLNASVDKSSPADGDYTDAGETAVTFTDGASAGANDVLTITTTANPASLSTSRSKLKDQFNEILKQVDKMAADASYNGVNLINSSSAKLKVAFNEKRDATNKSELEISGADMSSSGLGVSQVSSMSDTEANAALDQLTEALSTLRQTSSTFGSNLSTVQIRQDFTKDLMNTLQTGADALVLADTNEEGASMLALQTRQQLSTTALSLASQSDQAVLRLL